MIEILKKFPWWVWVGGIIAIFVIWQAATGAALTRKLYNDVLDQLRTDQSQVVQTLEDNQKSYEAEITRLQDQITKLQKDKAALAQDAAKSKAELVRLTGKINELQDALSKIDISNDPDIVLRDLQKRFPSLRRR